MSREYIKDRKLPPSNWGRTRWGAHNERNKRVTIRAVAKGLSLVHIGDDVWRVGRTKEIKNPNPDLYGTKIKIAHRVIYAPNGKEYHLYGKQVDVLTSYIWDNYLEEDYPNINRINKSQTKIYILTNILDDVNNWCFDLNKIPPIGNIKVIYNNGTIKNIEFDGEFKPIQKQKYAKCVNYSSYSYMNPVAYRIK